MSFRQWFRKWCISLRRLLTLGTKPYKSDSQRKRERERRKAAKYSQKNLYRKKKHRAVKHHNNVNARMISAMLGFMLTSLSLVLVPLKMLRTKTRHANSRGRAAHKTSPANTKNRTPTQKTAKRTDSASTGQENPHSAVPSQRKASAVPKNRPSAQSHKPPAEESPVDTNTKSPPIDIVADSGATTLPPKRIESDETLPKSVPKGVNDRYICQRMIIAGSSYCDQTVLEQLQIGTYLDIAAEPDNPYDANAIMLLLDGEKAGYIAKKDQTPYVTCLRLNRAVYAVVTDMIPLDSGVLQYEYETWFAGK